ncbi:MAG TPA: DUF1778 domain-containing protein [Jatrophihabitans sp.]|jgi:uncharacterized protein (DUF1778 family)
MTVTKTRRLELRTDEDTEQLIIDAAALRHMSKTAFVEDAVRTAARKVIARSDVTLMDPEVFDSMMSALDRPDESTELAELAKLPKLIDR